MLPAQQLGHAGLGVLPGPEEERASRVGRMKHRHPQNAAGAGSHHSSLRGGWWPQQGSRARSPAPSTQQGR